MKFPAHPAWDFATCLYAAPRVASACLELQERHGIDVTFMLFCMWHGAVEGLLADKDMEALAAAAADWHQTVVLPVRAARRRLKTGAAAGGGPDIAGLYKTVLATEIACEHAELLMLAGRAAGLSGAGEGSSAAIAGNLAAFFKASGVVLGPEDGGFAAILLDAAEKIR